MPYRYTFSCSCQALNVWTIIYTSRRIQLIEIAVFTLNVTIHFKQLDSIKYNPIGPIQYYYFGWALKSKETNALSTDDIIENHAWVYCNNITDYFFSINSLTYSHFCGDELGKVDPDCFLLASEALKFLKTLNIRHPANSERGNTWLHLKFWSFSEQY